MLARYILSLILLLSVLQLKAVDIASTGDIDFLTGASLPIVYGWYHKTDKDKWITKEKEIKYIDRFSDYLLLSLKDNDQKYVAIIKESKNKNDILVDTYIINYDVYADEIGQWLEGAVVRLPVLKHYKTQLKKGEELTASALGVNTMPKITATTGIYLVIQYKFCPDSTVKFLFYTENCNYANCRIEGLNASEGQKQDFKHIGNDSLYDNFYYKTTINYFIKFIDSPLNY